MIYDDYIAYSEEYRQKYGDRTVVLMEVGSFFEIYAVQNKDETSGADIGVICDLCNLQLSRKNKSIIENNRQNPLMAGFPSFALNKHTQLLLSSNYTVVLIRQVTLPPNPKREVTEILSPGLQLTPQGNDGSWLLVSYWDIHDREKNLNVGFCGIDVSTGQTWMYEVGQTNEALNEMIKCINMYQPREVIFIGSASLTATERTTITETAGVQIDSSRNYHQLWDALDTKYTQIKYQNGVLEKAYAGDFGMLSPIEALDMEKFDNVRTAFTFMLQFAYEHNPMIIQHLKKPLHLSFDKRCNLEHTSAVQLQLIGGSGGGANERPLLSILARCATAFGTRAFKTRLLLPTYDKDELLTRYTQIADCIDNVDIGGVYTQLRGVLDMERLTRRILLGTYSPTDWPSLDDSLGRVIAASEIASRVDIIDVAQSLISGYTAVLNLNECSKYLIGDIKGNIFKEGVYEDVDVADKKLKTAWVSLDAMISLFNDACATTGACRVEFNERDGYIVQVTKKRWDAIRVALPKMFNIGGTEFSVKEFEARSISTSSSVVKILHPWIHAQSDQILKVTKYLADLTTKRYKEFLLQYGTEFKAQLYSCVKLVSDLDVVITCARNAVEYKYVRPEIAPVVDTGRESGGWFKAGSLRHPILERIHTKTVYTPNDVSLGNGVSGMLLFGVNSSGKSSLMKAIGLNIIMAQAGMYVAADQFEFEPYKAVFTRIMGADDIYRGWSTFTVEMMELRNVLLKGDAYSLVLGDELCSGTESLSATAIVAAGIETLANKKASFVFATHLHDLAKMNRVKRDDVKMWHMHVQWVQRTDGSNTQEIIFDRKLREGVGSGVYGLEVCQGLNLPPEFIKLAHEVRCELEGRDSRLLAGKQSRYNSGVFMDACKICGNPPSETHHILPQAEADKEGFINHFHKNSTFNLMTVCEKCHDEIHAGILHVKGFIATSHGVRLDMNRTPSPPPPPLAPPPPPLAPPLPPSESQQTRDADVQTFKAKKYVRYHDGRWETRKTLRGPWTTVENDTVSAVLKKYGLKTSALQALQIEFLVP
jgi:DNA mismatch repair protein MutS